MRGARNATGRNRTCNPELRRLVLYPIELRSHTGRRVYRNTNGRKGPNCLRVLRVRRDPRTNAALRNDVTAGVVAQRTLRLSKVPTPREVQRDRLHSPLRCRRCHLRRCCPSFRGASKDRRRRQFHFRRYQPGTAVVAELASHTLPDPRSAQFQRQCRQPSDRRQSAQHHPRQPSSPQAQACLTQHRSRASLALDGSSVLPDRQTLGCH